MRWHLQLSCCRPSALPAARNQRRAAGRGPRAKPSHRTGDGWRLRRRVPARTALAGVLPIHSMRTAGDSCMLRCQARQLRRRKRRVAAASSGLVCARPTLLGASFACDFDPSAPAVTQFLRRDAACRFLQRCASSTLISVRSCTSLAADRRLTGRQEAACVAQNACESFYQLTSCHELRGAR